MTRTVYFDCCSTLDVSNVATFFLRFSHSGMARAKWTQSDVGVVKKSLWIRSLSHFRFYCRFVTTDRATCTILYQCVHFSKEFSIYTFNHITLKFFNVKFQIQAHLLSNILNSVFLFISTRIVFLRLSYDRYER